MRSCSKCFGAITFGAGLITASVLPTKVICVIAAVVLIITCISCGR